MKFEVDNRFDRIFNGSSKIDGKLHWVYNIWPFKFIAFILIGVGNVAILGTVSRYIIAENIKTAAAVVFLCIVCFIYAAIFLYQRIITFDIERKIALVTQSFYILCLNPRPITRYPFKSVQLRHSYQMSEEGPVRFAILYCRDESGVLHNIEVAYDSNKIVEKAQMLARELNIEFVGFVEAPPLTDYEKRIEAEYLLSSALSIWLSYHLGRIKAAVQKRWGKI